MKSLNPATPTKYLVPTITPTPIAGQAQIYAKADKLPYFQDQAGLETAISLGGGGGGGGLFDDEAIFTHQQPNGVAGGTSGITWGAIKINTTNRAGCGITLDVPNRRLTIPKGYRYLVTGWNENYRCNRVQCGFYNVTQSNMDIVGGGDYQSTTTSIQPLNGILDLTGAATDEVFEFKAKPQAGYATSGWGLSKNTTSPAVVEVYACLIFLRFA